jgi:hypothetical protein
MGRTDTWWRSGWNWNVRRATETDAEWIVNAAEWSRIMTRPWAPEILRHSSLENQIPLSKMFCKLGFKFPTAVTTRIAISWNVAQCRLVDSCWKRYMFLRNVDKNLPHYTDDTFQKIVIPGLRTICACVAITESNFRYLERFCKWLPDSLQKSAFSDPPFRKIIYRTSNVGEKTPLES